MPIQESEDTPPKPTKRCKTCKKRIGLMYFKCSCCGECFCVGHRAPEDHMCPGNFRQAAHEKNKNIVNEWPQDTHNHIRI